MFSVVPQRPRLKASIDIKIFAFAANSAFLGFAFIEDLMSKKGPIST